MRNKKEKLVILISMLILAIGTMFCIIAEQKCAKYADFKMAQLRLKDAETTAKNQSEVINELTCKQTELLSYRDQWASVISKAQNTNMFWSEITRISATKNLLTRLSEETDFSASIEIDGNLDNIVELIREIENSLPHIKFESITLSQSKYGEVKMTLKIQIPNLLC